MPRPRNIWPVVLLSLFLGSPAFCALTVVLTRHAEKAGSPAEDPPLSTAGNHRANLLASMLADSGVSAIYATQYIRTQQTAQPLSKRLGIPIEKFPAQNTAELVQAIRKHAGGIVLVVGHGTTVPAVISMLGGPAVEIKEAEFDNLFILTISAQDVSLLRLRYGAGMLGKRSEVVKIEFSRSGGFVAAPGMIIQGSVEFGDSGAHVTSDSGKYHRELTPQEAEQLRNSVNRNELPSKASSARDSFQYDAVITTNDGKTHRFTFGAGEAANEFLAKWIEQETQKMWEHRVANR